MLWGFATVYQASVLNGVAFDPFAFEQVGLAAAKVDVSRCEVCDALAATQMIVVADACKAG